MLLLLFISAKMRLIKPLTIQRLSSLPPPPLAHPPPTNSKTSSTVIFARNIVIVIAIMFFICGLLHILVRYLIKRKRLLSSSPNSHHHSSRFQESAGDDGEAYERQLQQLFNLHDSGLDQTFIDALPVFSYKELMGLKEPFDCAVCLCEFTKQDNLRLLPSCSHAFHMHCIDTWLLSNSTCPLCRGTLFIPGFSVENPVFEFDDSREEEDHGVSGHFKPSEGYTPPSGTLPVYRSHDHNGGGKPRTSQQQEVGPSIMDAHHPTTGASMRGLVKQSEGSIGNEKRVYSVRLGKFRATNVVKKEEKEMGETSNSNLDARRCYSMGTYEYVVATSDLQVAFVPNRGSSRRGSFRNKDKANGSNDGGSDGKKLSNRSKGESFSVSKIWLWSKKDHHHKGQISSGTHMVNSSVNVILPLRNANNSHT